MDMKMLGPLLCMLGIEFIERSDGLLLVKELYAGKLGEIFELMTEKEIGSLYGLKLEYALLLKPNVIKEQLYCSLIGG
jgi:hypothetical protein